MKRRVRESIARVMYGMVIGAGVAAVTTFMVNSDLSGAQLFLTCCKTAAAPLVFAGICKVVLVNDTLRRYKAQLRSYQEEKRAKEQEAWERAQFNRRFNIVVPQDRSHKEDGELLVPEFAERRKTV